MKRTVLDRSLHAGLAALFISTAVCTAAFAQQQQQQQQDGPALDESTLKSVVADVFHAKLWAQLLGQGYKTEPNTDVRERDLCLDNTAPATTDCPADSPARVTIGVQNVEPNSFAVYVVLITGKRSITMRQQRSVPDADLAKTLQIDTYEAVKTLGQIRDALPKGLDDRDPG